LSTVSRRIGCPAYAGGAAVRRGFIRVTTVNASAMKATETYPVPCSKSRANRMTPVVGGRHVFGCAGYGANGLPGTPEQQP
jgi:hypothetical protein